MNRTNNVLIVVPSFKILGGVANHYMGLFPHWKNKVEHCFYGKRDKIPAILCFFPDILIFIYKLIFHSVDVVIINPSLRRYQLFRDSLYLLIAIFLKKKVVTFIHGWDNQLAEKIQKKPFFFRNTYGRSLFIYVLCSDFKIKLETLKLQCPILLTTTKVSNEILEYSNNRVRDSIKQILFLARIEESKGIFITLDMFKLLKAKNPNLRLVVCGTGGALEAAKSYTKREKIEDVYFKGRVSGRVLVKQFDESDIYVLPSFHEGMATSVLEAMALGLPILSRPVGGIKDFFKNGEMGFLVSSLEAKDFADIIQCLINDPEKVKKISQVNRIYAREHFLASRVVENFENDLSTFLQHSKNSN